MEKEKLYIYNSEQRYISNQAKEMLDLKNFIISHNREDYYLYINEHNNFVDFIMKNVRQVYSFSSVGEKEIKKLFKEHNIEFGENVFYKKGFINNYYENSYYEKLS